MRVKEYSQAFKLKHRKNLKYYNPNQEVHTIKNIPLPDSKLKNLSFGEDINIHNWHTKIHKIDWSLATTYWNHVHDFLGNNIFMYAILQNKIQEIPINIQKAIGPSILIHSENKTTIQSHIPNSKWDGKDNDFENKIICPEHLINVCKNHNELKNHIELLNYMHTNCKPRFKQLVSLLDTKLSESTMLKYATHLIVNYTVKKENFIPILDFMPDLFNTLMLMDVKKYKNEKKIYNISKSNEPLYHIGCIKGRGIHSKGYYLYKTEINNQTYNFITEALKNKTPVDIEYLAKILYNIENINTWGNKFTNIINLFNTEQKIEYISYIQIYTHQACIFKQVRTPHSKFVNKLLKDISQIHPEFIEIYNEFNTQQKLYIKTQI